MQRPESPVLDAEETLAEAATRAESSEMDDLLVRMSPTGWSIATRQQLRNMLAEGKGATKLSSLLPLRLIPQLHPDHPLETALRYVDRWPVVPVVNRADSRQLEGIITQRDVLERYREYGEG